MYNMFLRSHNICKHHNFSKTDNKNRKLWTKSIVLGKIHCLSLEDSFNTLTFLTKLTIWEVLPFSLMEY